MVEIGLLKFAHILCLAYWLGADLGVFYSSFFVVNDKLATETRLSMAKLLFALDQGPRLCMPLMLATGVHLASAQGWVSLPGGAVAVTWLICLGWLAMVFTLHARASAALTMFDYWFRVAMIVGLGGYAIYALTQELFAAWLGYKLLIYAGLVTCGLMIRRKLKSFGPAFAALARDEASAADNAAIRSSLGASRPFVIAIWAGLLINTALGIHLL